MFTLLKDNDILNQIFTSENITNIIRSVLFFIAGFILIRLTVFLARKITAKRVSRQSSMIVDKIITYTGMSILIIIVLSELGVNLAALLGAAGVLGIAIGVASQKSIGNMVSGFFLLSEKPFEVGDVVKIDSTMGIILDVDLLSLKIRTFDNQLVRIPNEVIISTIITNVTRFPIRRLDFNFTVTYGEDLDKLEEILRELAVENPLVLDEPDPLFVLKEYGEKGIDVLFGVWFLKDNYLQVKNKFFKEILKALKENEMTIPFPQIVLHNAVSPLEEERDQS